ncbi:hypothetical protein HZS_4269 [Henneguya salminicola]|nr:hypothetical protein HZS_4269 [Henneguya salminicola]
MLFPAENYRRENSIFPIPTSSNICIYPTALRKMQSIKLQIGSFDLQPYSFFQDKVPNNPNYCNNLLLAF